MADITRTEYGRILCRKKYVLNHTALNSFNTRGYKKLFSPSVRKNDDFARISMGYHSEVFAFSKTQNFFNKMLHK